MRYERALCGECRMSRIMLKDSRLLTKVWIFYIICKHSGTKISKILSYSDARIPYKVSLREHLQPDIPPDVRLRKLT